MVEGWKKRDQDKEEQLEHARQEKEEIENRMKKQEQVRRGWGHKSELNSEKICWQLVKIHH